MPNPTATIFAPWHALDEFIQRGTRAAQPAAADVVPGTLYGVTDEGDVVERSNGTAWEAYSPTGGGGGVPAAHHVTHEPGGSDALAVDAATAIGSLRTLGTGPTQAAPGNDARFTTLAAHHLTHEPGGSDALTALSASILTSGTLPDARLSSNVALKNVDNNFTTVQTANGLILPSANALQLFRGDNLRYSYLGHDNTSAYWKSVVGGDGWEFRNSSGAAVAGISYAGLLTVNGFGTHSFNAGGTGGNGLRVTNPTAGASNYALLSAQSDSVYVNLQALSGSYTTSGPYLASSAVLRADGAGGISVLADHPSGAIRFYSGGATQRATFLADGKFIVGGPDTPAGPAVQTNYFNGYIHNGLSLSEFMDAAGSGFLMMYVGPTLIGNIARVGTTNSVAYGTTSDVRLKTDRGPATDLTALRALTVHDFAWRADGASDRGIFAQEAHAIFPRAVCVGSDGDDLSRPWMTDYSKFVPDLIVGWQSHDARILELESELARLKAHA